MATVLCTGGAGFIAGHLVKALLDQGDDVRAADIRPLAQWKQVHPDAENLSLLDVSDAEQAAWAAQGCEVIYHLAADSGGMGYISYHHADCMSNILADVQMARVALAAGAKIYYASSSCAYPLHIQDDPFTPPIREEDLLANKFNPEQGYGWEKLFAEMCYQAFAQDKGLRARVGRYFSVYGPMGWFEGGREKAPTALCRKVARAKILGQDWIEVWGDGTARRTFTYVDDAVAATLAITALDDEHYDGPLNVGSPKACSIDELVTVIEDIAGHKVRRQYVPGPVGVGGRPSDDTKIHAMTGWKAQVPFTEGMERTYEWTFNQVKAKLGA